MEVGFGAADLMWTARGGCDQEEGEMEPTCRRSVVLSTPTPATKTLRQEGLLLPHLIWAPRDMTVRKRWLGLAHLSQFRLGM